MTEDATKYELSAEGQATIEAIDGYLEQTIRDGRPLEALIATRRLGEITSERAKEAARAATEGSWSWSDVGRALGVTKQAAHEKLHARPARVRQGPLEARPSRASSSRQGRARRTERTRKT
jgi:hypothetical protein